MILSCPSNNPPFIPLKAFPALSVETTGTVLTGSQITASANLNGWTGPVYSTFVGSSGPVWAPLQLYSNGKYTIIIPAGVHGQSYLLLTKTLSSVNDDTIVAGPAIVMIGGTDGVPNSA